MRNISMKWITFLCFSVLTVSVSASKVESLLSGTPTHKGDHVESHALTKVPQNTVAVVRSTVVLECFVDNANPKDAQFMWIEYTNSQSGNYISNNTEILQTGPNWQRYRIIQSTPLDYSLEISDVRLSDGARYECWDRFTSAPRVYVGRAQLIVIESFPACTKPISSDGIAADVLAEGEIYTIECNWAYQGNYAPNITWSGPPPFQLYPSSIGNNAVRTNIEFTADRSIEEGVYKIAADFQTIKITSGYCCWAENTPDWRSVFSLPSITINWPPSKVYIEPLKTRYYVGEILTCHAYANPSPFYQWLNSRTLETVYGQTFTITESMVGFNQTLLCQAQNFISDKLYSTQVTIEVLGAKET